MIGNPVGHGLCGRNLQVGQETSPHILLRNALYNGKQEEHNRHRKKMNISMIQCFLQQTNPAPTGSSSVYCRKSLTANPRSKSNAKHAANKRK
jgi:hypothetical protein